MEIWCACIILALLTLIVSIGLKHHRKSGKQREKMHFGEHILQLLFPFHFALTIFAFVLSGYWFCTGKNVIKYDSLWMSIVERGTIDALVAVMSVVGVSSVLLGWIYSERDKLTLGKSQVDMIHYKYGFGYAGSVIAHFVSSALAILMLKCTAKEAALWAFFAVAWGCFPQAQICLMIAMNREHRESLAVQLWEQDSSISKERVDVIRNMSEYLSDTEVRYNTRYRDTLGTVIKDWLLAQYTEAVASRGINQNGIKMVSAFFRKIVDKIPEEERATYEEELLKSVCDKLNSEKNLEEDRQNAAALLLGCGYIRFLYAQAKEELGKQINRTVYFHQHGNKVYQNCLDWMQDMLCALEWVLFLKQQTVVPRNASGKSPECEYAETAFVQLILSLWKEKDSDIEEIAKISWRQLKIGGEQE